jgi:hypothetical protein
MRLRRALALVGALAAAGASLFVTGSSAVPSDHGTEPWAGQWTTSTGGVAWRAFNEQDLEIAKRGKDRTELFDKLPCKDGPRFYRGGYTAGADRGKIMGCGTPTNMRGRWLSNVGGQFQNGSYEIHISSRNPLRFTGTFRQDDGVSGVYSGTWSSHFDGDGCCADGREPELPDALVPLTSVSYGCGGGKATLERRFGDTSTYLDGNNPAGKRYPVSFREACNLHDAGYSGAKVADPLHGGRIVDFFTWTQLQVDDKFLEDMLLICNRSISALARSALADCRGTGGKTSLGARSRYNFVRDAGDLFYQERPKLRGFWASQADRDAPAWTIAHTLRDVRASWRGGTAHPTLRGQFKGVLITRDDDSVVAGFATITETGKPEIRNRAMRLTWNPDQPDRLVMSGPGGPLTLVRK